MSSGPGRADRRPAHRARAAGAADRRPAADPAARHRRAPRVVRLPRAPPADELVPRRAGADPGPGVRQPLPHREGRWRRLHRPRTRTSWSRSPQPPVSRSRTPGSTRRPHSASTGCRRPPRSPPCSRTTPARRRPAGGRRPGPRGVRRRRVVGGRAAADATAWSCASSPGRPPTSTRCGRMPWSSPWPMRSSAPASRSRCRTSPRSLGPWTRLRSRAGRSSGRSIVVPLRRRRGVEGALALAWTPRARQQLHDVDAAMPASFAEQAALAIQVARAREDQQRLDALRGPGPDRPRPARPRDPAALRGRAQPGECRPPGARTPSRLQALRRPWTTSTAPSRTSGAPSSRSARWTRPPTCRPRSTRIVDRAAATLKFRPTFRFEGPVRSLVGADLAPDLLAVLGEALSNASRHADASSGRGGRQRGGRDRAQGESTTARGSTRTSLESGLGNMRERAHKHGGTLSVDSEPGRGRP